MSSQQAVEDDEIEGDLEEEEVKRKLIKMITGSEQRRLNLRLLFAAMEGKLEEVKESLTEGAEINYTVDGYTPLFAASAEGQGAGTPLYVASYFGHQTVVSYLLQKKADPNISDESGDSPLHVAETVEIANLLLKAGANAEAVTNEGNNVLHESSKEGNDALVNFWLSKGFDTENRNNFGETAIHLSSNIQVAECLLSKGADMNVLTTDNNTVLHSVCKYGHWGVLLYFLEKGFSLKAQNKQGDTPVDILKQHSDDEWVQYCRGECLELLKKNNYYSESDEEQADIGSTSKPTDEEASGPTRRRNRKDDEEMADFVRSQIEEKGEMKQKNVKGILIGPPGVGKTVTINRLTGEVRNIALDGGSGSTGIEKPLVIPLYHDTGKCSIVIGPKHWSSQTIDQQLGIYLGHCKSQSPAIKDERSVSSDIPKDKGEVTKAPSHQGRLTVSYQSKPVHAHPRVSLDKSFHVVQQFIKESKWDEVQRVLEVLDVKDMTLFHVIDTGGQPEFFEILPLLLRGPCFSLIFMNLAHSLKDPFQVTYRDTATTHYPVEYDSTYTQLDMIHMLLSAIHSLNTKKNGSQRSAAFLIGTHLDEAKDADIQKTEKEIEKSLRGKAFFKDTLAQHYCPVKKFWSLLYTLDNMNGSEEEISTLREILTNIIKKKFPSESLPTSWGLFHLMLRHKYEEKGFCSLEESIELGIACGLMEKEEVIKALHFLHSRFGTVLYYDDVESLKSMVICDPNLLFRPITRIVAESFGANPYNREISRNIRETGEISYNFFEEVCKENDPLQRIPTSAIIDLLKYHNIVTEIGNGDKRLFMSCLLQPCPPEESAKASRADQTSLLFTFCPHGYQPICLFHVLTSKLLQSKKFKLDEIRHRNKISFRYNGIHVELLSKIAFLEIRANTRNQKKCVLLQELLQQELDAIIDKIPHMQDTKVEPAFFCPASIHGSSETPHIAVVEKSDDQSSRSIWCSKCKKQLEVEAHHEMWFKDLCAGVENEEEIQTPVAKHQTLQNPSSADVQMSKCPKWKEAFNILKKKAGDWDDFAREFDIPDDIREDLRKDNSRNSRAKLEAVLKKWIELSPSPVTWQTIIDVLEELEFRDTIRDVKEYLESSKVARH